MTVKIFNQLPEEAVRIREEVFKEEQGFSEEFDEIDNTASHLVMYQDSLPVATCRYYPDTQKDAYIIGRIAVTKTSRGQNIGAEILKAAEDQIRTLGGNKVSLSAQIQAEDFYKKQGYTAKGPAYYEEHCPHIQMHKTISNESD